MASVCGGSDHDREFYSEKYFASRLSHFTLTVFAFLHIQNILSHRSAEGEKMDKKTTGIVAYITWIGWIVAFCAGDKEGAKFRSLEALSASSLM